MMEHRPDSSGTLDADTLTILAQNPEQQEAIEHTDGPLLIIAGAGTGKTRVIVEKVGHLLQHVSGLRPESILALTFSEKAAAEMEQRAAARFGEAARGCRFSTFHSFCYRLLFEESPRIPPWKSLDDIDHWIFLRRNLESLDLDYYLHVSEPSRFLHDLLEFCSRCHDNLVSPEAYSDYVEQLGLAPKTAGGSGKNSKSKSSKRFADTPEQEIARQREVARVFARSEQLQESAGLLNFGAMIARAVALLEDSTEVLARLRRRYRFILVDEFQDTNWAQIELLRLLAGESKNVTAVGDRKQAIYHFRGASHTSFDLFRQTFPGYAQVVLRENYRLTKRILSVAETAIALSPEKLDEPDQPLKTSNLLGPKAEVWEFISGAEQAEFLARQIVRQVQSNEAQDFSDFAVLYRAHQHRNGLVRALRSHGIPFSIRKLAINNHPRVRDLVACLRAIGHPNDSISLIRLIGEARWQIRPELLLRLCHAANARRAALSEIIEAELAQDSPDMTTSEADAQELRPFSDFLNRYREIAKQQRFGDWLQQLKEELGLFHGPEEESFWNAFSGFVRTWDSEKSSTGLLAEFLEYFGYFEEAGGTITLPDPDAGFSGSEFAPGKSWGLAPGRSAEPRQGSLFEPPGALEEPSRKVQLMTMHSAKGLEFEHVILLNLVRGAFPSKRQTPLIEFPSALLKGPAPQGDVHQEEERRLFYVALTRARKRLTLCTVANDKKRPSVFLGELRDLPCPDLEWKRVPPCGAPAAGAVPIPPILAGAAQGGNLVLSVSGLETYRECPMKYYFSKVCRIPVSPSAALRFGSIMHGAVRQMVSSLAREADKVTDAVMETFLRENWAEAGFGDPVQERKYWAMGLEQLQGLRRTLSDQPFVLLSQERSFHFFRGGIKLAGRIDQLNRLGENRVELIEYKTGRAQSQKDADHSLQLTVYALACREVLGLEAAELVLYNLQTQERLRTRREAGDFRNLEESLGQTSENILAGRFPASPGYHCRYCDFRPLCPAHDESG